MFIKNEYISQLLIEAEKAYNENCVPVSALLINEHNFFYDYNQSSILDHAEILVIKKAELFYKKQSINYNFDNSVLIVSMEPCMMCLGAIIHAHIKKVYYLISSDKESFYVDFNSHIINYSKFYKNQIPLLLPINNFDKEKEEYKKLIKNFFHNKR